MNSRNHPAFSSVGAWMYRWLAGLRIDSYGEGYRKVLIAPSIVDEPSLSSCNASVMTSYGPVRSSWSYDAEKSKLEITVELPPNTVGRVVPPKVAGGSHRLMHRMSSFTSAISTTSSSEMQVGSGKHRFLIAYDGEAYV